MARISYIKTCTVCEHFEKHYKGRDKTVCEISGKRQVSNVANNCEYFKGEKYAFNHDRAHTIGERPSTFSKT